MNSDEERYVHFVGSLDNLHLARKVLLEVKQAEKHSLLTAAALRAALIEYAKPYKKSEGVYGPHRLSDNRIPADALDLHKKILTLRDQVLAHSDLTVRDAKVHVKEYGQGQIVTVVSHVVEASIELGDIDAVVSLIERTLDNMYTELAQLEKALPRAP